MSLAAVFDKLGQQVMPKVARAVFPDLADITAFANVSDGAGGQYTTATTPYEDVPCTYEPIDIEFRRTVSDRTVSVQEYRVTMPTHDADAVRIDLNPETHRITVQARGNEPAKVFRIISIGDVSGVVFECICHREN